ncbi:MAG: hypothetical protein ABR550_11095 [Wenzhouxiangellaceae bacterium]
MLVFSVLAASPVPAQIYRCVEGETTIFSDRPCSENVEIHQPAGRLSVIAVTSDLEAISARNRAFIDQRLNRIASARERAVERRESRPPRRGPVTYPVVNRGFGIIGATHPRSRLNFRDRSKRDQEPLRKPRRAPVSEDSWTLSGRQLGSRRSDEP